VAEHERRRFFRVSDSLGVRYTLLNDIQNVESSENSHEMDALVDLENKISAALEPLRAHHPQLLEVLSLFNQKINLFFHRENQQDQFKTLDNVNLSACGIAFPIEEQLSLNQLIKLDIILYPSHIMLTLKAAVIGCEALNTSDYQGEYLLRADFLDLEENDQEVLVQHVIKCQSQQLKRARESRESGEKA
jgi:c-di-GMP-binding flagellar brake protein YcgR